MTISFDIAFIRCARELDWPLCGLVLTDLSEASINSNALSCIDYIFLDHRLLTSGVQIKDLQIQTIWTAYEVSDVNVGLKLLKDGFDLIESYNPLSLF